MAALLSCSVVVSAFAASTSLTRFVGAPPMPPRITASPGRSPQTALLLGSSRKKIAKLQEEQERMAEKISALETRVQLLDQARLDAEAAATAAPAAGHADLISRADELHAASDVDALFELLQDADTSNSELAWRVARAHHDKAEDSEEVAGDAARKEKLLRDGLAVAEAAMQASKSGYALKWYAILLGRLGDFLPTKEKVGNSYKIKDSLERAAELLPEDASVQTALGQWCYKVASISWIERNVAKALFGAPPESSYEEALGFVVRSHALRPTKKAALFAGLSSARLTERAQAIVWFEKCLALESVGESDFDLDRQAEEALRGLR